MKEKNADIEFLRFFMILAVTALHFSEDYIGNYGILTGGYLGVDFFFILSGFLLAKHFKKDNAAIRPFDKAQRYLWYRIKQLYLPYIIAIALYVGTLFAKTGFKIEWLLHHIWETKWQYIFLHYLGAPVAFEYRSIWFMPALVLLSYLIYFFLCYNTELFLGLSPVMIIFIYIWIYVTYGKLAMQGIYVNFLHGSIIRGFAGMTLGVLAYKFAETYAKELCLSRKRFSNIVKILCFLLIVYVMRKWGFDQNDFVVIPAMFVLIIVAYVCPFQFPQTIRKVILFGGGISYWIYVLHLLISLYIVEFLPGRSYGVILIVFEIITILFSAFVSLAFQRIRRNEKV